MKMNGLRVELVTEFAKDLVWAGRKKCLSDQMYVIAMQNHRLEVLRGQVDYVITDSPIPLGIVYAPAKYFKSFPTLIMEIFNSYENQNFYVTRKTFKYAPEGRKETEQEAEVKGKALLQLLEDQRVLYEDIDGNSKVLPDVYYKVVRKKPEVI